MRLALKDGLAFSAHYLQHCEVKLEVFGDSQMIIAAQNGFASIRQTKLQPLAVRVNQIIASFAWTSWNHTKREQNKMADLLANMAVNSKNAKILTDESRGDDQVVMSQVAALLDSDIGATPSKLRNTSLSAVLMRLRSSSTLNLFSEPKSAPLYGNGGAGCHPSVHLPVGHSVLLLTSGLCFGASLVIVGFGAAVGCTGVGARVFGVFAGTTTGTAIVRAGVGVAGTAVERAGVAVVGTGVVGAAVVGAGVSGVAVVGAGVVGTGVVGAGVSGVAVVGTGVVGAAVVGAGVSGVAVVGAGVVGAAVE
ncbi:hypothetical protein FI667_g10679, partial [Globisporangium splendens]